MMYKCDLLGWGASRQQPFSSKTKISFASSFRLEYQQQRVTYWYLVVSVSGSYNWNVISSHLIPSNNLEKSKFQHCSCSQTAVAELQFSKAEGFIHYPSGTLNHCVNYYCNLHCLLCLPPFLYLLSLPLSLSLMKKWNTVSACQTGN